MKNQPDEKRENKTDKNSQIEDDASSESGCDHTLGAKLTARLLIVARSSETEVVTRLRAMLEACDHIVSVSSLAEWQDVIEAAQPVIVLVETAASAVRECAALCTQVKKRSPELMVLAILSQDDDDTFASVWPEVREAGADDFISSDVSRYVLESRVLLLTRFSENIRRMDAVHERLARHMQIDETTQLLNRRFFFQAALRECSRARRYGHPLSCLMVDIDYLDDIGRTFGYGCAEYVLRGVSYAVRQWTRDSDIVGRFSERKFAVLLPETEVDGAVTVREKILNAIAESQFLWDGKDLPIRVTIGEAERSREFDRVPTNLSGVNASTADESSGNDGTVSPADSGLEEGAEPISVREELAALLEDADAALNVARRATLRPDIFVQYTPSGGH